MTQFANTPTETRTSQTALSLLCDIPASLSSSSKNRSSNDPSMGGHKKFYLLDTPGHGKLRSQSISQIGSLGTALRGIIFVIDSSLADISDAAGYLYDVLLAVQRQVEATGSGKGGMRILIACNKSDLFTALPPGRVKRLLEEELGKIRDSRSRGVLDVQEEGEEKEREWLGEGGDGDFTFAGLEDSGIEVEVKGGNVNREQWRQGLGEWVGAAL